MSSNRSFSRRHFARTGSTEAIRAQKSQHILHCAHFDTSLIEPELRLEAWHENMGVLFDLSTEQRTKQDNRIYARIDVCSFGDTVFGVTEANTQLFVRDHKCIAREGVDHILVQVFLKGGGETSDGVRTQAGDMLVIDLDQPHEMLNSDFSNLTLVLPRDLHPRLSDLLAPLHSRHMTNADPLVRHMGTHLLSLWDNISEMSLDSAETALTGSLGLLECWLSSGNVRDPDEGVISSALDTVVKHYIERHLAEPLSPALIATAFRISRSHLYRIFSEDGGVSRYIWIRRLRRAMRMLTQAPYQRLPIIAIAFECGFTSGAHFSRSFRAHYGLPPSRARADAMANQSPVTQGQSAPTKPYRTDLADWIRGL